MKQLSGKARLVSGARFQDQDLALAVGESGCHCAACDAAADDDDIGIKGFVRACLDIHVRILWLI